MMRWTGAALLAAGLALMAWNFPLSASQVRRVLPTGPGTVELNPWILTVAAAYPTDGSMKSLGLRDPGFSGYGVSKDLEYSGWLLTKGTPEGKTHCIGFVFEVYLQALEQYRQQRDRSVPDGLGSLQALKQFAGRFYGNDGNRGTFVDALIAYNLGREITDMEQAKRGDLVQYWRRRGTGHAGIFWEWRRDQAGKIIGMYYLQSGGQTGGISFDELWFDLLGSDVERKHVYLVRPLVK